MAASRRLWQGIAFLIIALGIIACSGTPPSPAVTSTAAPPPTVVVSSHTATPAPTEAAAATPTEPAPTEATPTEPTPTEVVATPTPTDAQPTPTPETSTGGGDTECTDVLAFFEDVTIPDGTPIRQGESFTKT